MSCSRVRGVAEGIGWGGGGGGGGEEAQQARLTSSTNYYLFVLLSYVARVWVAIQSSSL